MAREEVSKNRTSRKSDRNKNVKSMNNARVSKNERIKNEPRNKRKKKGTLKFLFVIFLLAAITTCIYLLLKHQTFNIIAFNLDGTEKYTSDQITEKLGINIGENIFIQTLSADKKKIAEFPYIESVDFDFHLPNVLSIKVVERIPKYFAYDKEKNTFFKIDENGYILEQSKIENKSENELLVYGITFDDEVVLGDKVNEIDMSKIFVFLDVKNEFEKSGINRNITKVNFENSLTTLTLNDKLNVIFPNNDDLTYKMALLGEILKSIGEDAVGTVDLNKTDPTYSSF